MLLIGLLWAGHAAAAGPDAPDGGALAGSQPPLECDFATAIGAVAEREDIQLGRTAARADAARLADLNTVGSWQVQIFPSVRFAPDRAPELQAGVQRMLPTGDRGKARRGAARAETQVQRAHVDAQVLEARMDAASAFFRTWTATRIVEVLKVELGVAAESVALARRARRAGAGSAHAVAEAEAVRAELESELVRAEHALHHAAIDLAHSAGLPLGRPLRVVGSLPVAPLPAGARLDRAVANVERLPAVRLARLRRAAARARAAEAEANNSPSFQVGGWLETGMPREATLRLTLGWNTAPTGQRAAAALRGMRAEQIAAADIAAARRAATAALLDATHELRHSAEALRVVRERQLPAAERRLELRRAALDAGAGRLIDVLAAQRAALRARIAAIRWRSASRWAAVRLWLLLTSAEGQPRP